MKWRFIAIILFLLLLVSSCQPAPGPAQVPSPTSPPSAPQVEPRLQPPNSPSSLIGEPLSQSIVNLHWIDGSDNEDGFKIYRDGDVIATTGVNSANYRDAGLEAGRTYHYAVRAYNAAGESGASSYTVKMPNPPLNVAINYIGVKFDHDPTPVYPEGEIRLILFVSDGNQTVQEIIPPGEGAYLLNDYETMELKQRVFHTASAGEYLKVVIMAYEDDPETQLSNTLKVALPVIASVFGVPILGDVGTVFSQYEEMTGKPLFENKDDYVGYFEGFWGSDESWGIGQHNAVGTGDFRVWLSIWSDNQPPLISKPALSPDVTIQSVDVPSEVEVGRAYTYHITLMNNESHSVSVMLKIHSSVTGDVDSQSVTVPANGTITVKETTKFQPAGVRTITYTVVYKGEEIHSLVKTVEAKAPDITIESVDVPAEVVVGRSYTYDITLRNNSPNSATVTLKIHSSVTGDVGSQSVTIPANSTITVKDTTRFEPAGVRTITYTVLYKGEEIHSLSKTVEAKAPDVTIESVDVPAEVVVGKSYTYDITLRNNSPNSATVTLKIHSSVTGDVGSKSVTVPANGTITVKDTTRFEPAGVRTMTYTVLYKGEEIHSLSKTVEAKAPQALSVNFDGWYVDGSKVNTTTKDKTVTARITLSGGDSGQYKMRIRRDIRWASDSTVDEVSFSYDGVSITMELSFTPPYATDEASTDGYLIDLIKDGFTVWDMINAYPPRLRVTGP